ncbi:MAG TPA: carbamoyltransferase N-terminal domain-containing protein, partial [Gemmatimonadales bacterium]|nr:carbamoyltransferase N-terminal domain-containing protein [Gemmatimonadales bacterium]
MNWIGRWMYTLGINAAFHDSSACLVEDGVVIAASEEERFTRIKHGKRPVPFSTWELPYHAIDDCLRQGSITLTDVDHVAYAFDPTLRVPGSLDRATFTLPIEPSANPVPAGWEAAWDPLFVASIVNAPRHLAGGAPHHLKSRFSGARPDGPYRWHFVEHHVAHAASAFLASPFEHAAVMTLDGRGERVTTAYFQGCGTNLRRIGEVEMPHSLGILYEQVTEYLGFLHSSDEYKVMALASYGEPAYVDDFRSIVRRWQDGDYTIAAPCLEQRFGLARVRGGQLEQRHFDVARSLQIVLEETVLDIAHWLQTATGERDLCLAGGVALNCVMNARIRDEGPFDRIWVQPAAGDAGTALGAALAVDARERGAEERRYRMDHAYLGPCYADAEIESFLTWAKLPFLRLENVPEEAATLLAGGNILGWFQGRMEFGPRALGGRSILGDARSPTMQRTLNLKVKYRESFRPFAPSVLR